MIFLSAVLAIVGFLVGFQATGIVGAATRIVGVARQAGAVMSDKKLDDEQKEKAIQSAALSMMGGAVSIFVRISLTLLATVLPIYLLSWLGLAPANDVFAFLARIDVIIGATVVVGGGLWLWSKRPKSESKSNYSTMDRLVHKLAFAAPFVQATAADVEDGIFGRDIEGVESRAPVFVTSLPRAGTTVVLNALHELPETATHLYRDMPFIMAPLFWSRLSGADQKSGELSERAHGDGIKVGYDSPEAFEEVIWRHFWPDHYKDNRIEPWKASDKDAEAQEFLTRHFRKIIALRNGKNGRYVSKNNGNIARIDLLAEIFPDCHIVVPLRDPAEHAASLLRQHKNFLTQHHQDPFVKRYMRDIGHYEFGELHRPIGFDGLDAAIEGRKPEDPDYWLAYWLAATRAVEARRDRLILLPEAALQDDPQAQMTALCARIDMDPGDVDFTTHIRKIPHRADRSQFDAALLAESDALYRALTSAA